MEGSLTEFDVLAVLPTLQGEDPEASAERLLFAFEAKHPEAGAVTSVDLERGTFDVAFTVEAADAYAAFEAAKAPFSQAAAAADLEPRPLNAIHVDHVNSADRHAVPA